MSTESVMPSNHLILCCPLLLPSSIFASTRVFSNESVLCIRWPRYWSFSFSINPSNEFPLGLTGLISLQFKGLSRIFSQHHSSKASILQLSALFIVQLSHPSIHDYWKNHSLWQSNVFFNMLSRLVIAFLPRTKCLLISWLQSPPAMILEPKKIKSVSLFPLFPILFDIK